MQARKEENNSKLNLYLKINLRLFEIIKLLNLI